MPKTGEENMPTRQGRNYSFGGEPPSMYPFSDLALLVLTVGAVYFFIVLCAGGPL